MTVSVTENLRVLSSRNGIQPTLMHFWRIMSLAAGCHNAQPSNLAWCSSPGGRICPQCTPSAYTPVIVDNGNKKIEKKFRTTSTALCALLREY